MLMYRYVSQFVLFYESNYNNKMIDRPLSFASLHPKLAMEWNFGRNKNSPEDYAPLSNKKVWWKCVHCGYEWEAVIANRSRGSGCPKCNYRKASENRCSQIIQKKGSLADNHPDLLKEWNYEKNNGHLSPTDVSSGSQKKVWWRCSVCGHEWRSMICHRVRGSHCPKCSYRNRQASNLRTSER